jgi:ribonuclease HI
MFNNICLMDGVVGVVGIIMDPRWKSITYYSSSLGIAPNNRAEAYTLWQGFKVAKEMSVHSIIIIGDSKIIINHMVNNSKSRVHPLASILDQCKQETSLFLSCTFYHVLCELNNEENHWPNYGASLKIRELVVNGTLQQHLIP